MNFYEFCEYLRNKPVPKLKLQWEYNANTFKSWLMSEITKDLVKDLESWYIQNSGELPFHSLFGPPKDDQHQATRTVIPFQGDPLALSILEKFNQGGISPGSAYAPNMYMHLKIEFETFSKDEDVDDVLEFVSFLDKQYNNFVSMVVSVYHKVWVANYGKPQPQTATQTTPAKTWHQQNYPQMYGPDGELPLP